MLKIEKLSCGYGPLIVVHELDLIVREGSIHALVGANGAGKTTSLMTIAGHVPVLSGSIRIGTERMDLSSHKRTGSQRDCSRTGRPTFIFGSDSARKFGGWWLFPTQGKHSS